MAAERKIALCVQHRCSKCPLSQTSVPETCEFEMLHLLEVNDHTGKIHAHARQSGKTTKLVQMANEFAKAGYLVSFIVPNDDHGRHTQRSHRFHHFVRIVSKDRAMQGLHTSIHRGGQFARYRECVAVFTDELSPRDIRNLNLTDFGPDVRYIGGFYTLEPSTNPPLHGSSSVMSQRAGGIQPQYKTHHTRRQKASPAGLKWAKHL